MIDQVLVNLANEVCPTWIEHVDLNQIYIINPNCIDQT
jgi:hypothetical protein